MRFYRRVNTKLYSILHYFDSILNYIVILIDNYYKRQKNSTIKKTSKTEQQWMLNIRNSKRGLLAWDSVTEIICLSTKLKAVSRKRQESVSILRK
jgi:hypothetical protein